MKPVENFSPDNPLCPQCSRPLNKGKRIDSIRYDEIKATMHIVVCKCRAATGYVVLDNYDPNDPYIVKDITHE